MVENFRMPFKLLPAELNRGSAPKRASVACSLTLAFLLHSMPAQGLAGNGRSFVIVFLPQQIDRSGDERRDLLAGSRHNGQDDATLFSQVDSDIAGRKLDEAEALLQVHLRLRPDSAGTLYRLGRVYFDRHAWDRSADFLQHSLKIDSHNDRAHLILGLDYFQLNRLEEAGRELLIAVKLNPQSDENQYMAGRYFFTKSKRTEALAFFYQAVRLNPQNFKVHHSLGLCFANLGNYALAEKYYKQAIELAEKQNIKFQQGYLDLADLLTGIESAKVPEGEIFARRAAELSPDSSEAHYFVGKALFREGKRTEAIPELLRSVNLDAKDTKPHFLLAKIYQKMGREAEAKAEYETFRQLMKLQTERGQTPSSRGLLPVH